MGVIENWNAWMKVVELFEACTDEEVLMWFDLDSEKMLNKKIRVLTAINEGRTAEEIGPEYDEILEKKPKW